MQSDMAHLQQAPQQYASQNAAKGVLHTYYAYARVR